MDKTTPKITEIHLDSILSFLETQKNFVFLDTNRIDSSNFRSYIFSGLEDRITLTNGSQTEKFFKKAEEYLKKGFYLSGWIAYELGNLLEPALNSQQDKNSEHLLADLGVFRAPIIFDHKTGQFNHDIPTQKPKVPVENIDVINSPAFTIQNLRTNQEKEGYLKQISRIKSYIEAGDTYQVNYTLKLLFDFLGEPSALYKTLRNNQSVSYGAYLKLGDQIIQSFSPELFFRKTGNLCTVRPMKGTRARGKTISEDKFQADVLQKDAKNRSENVMIVDLLRNDLGRICQMGQVKMISLFDIETFQTLHQMTSTIEGNLHPNIGLMELFRALFPCGSVTGAPKIRTMEIINELELAPRGVYTGAIGFISPQRDMVFNVPIRTVVLNKNKGEMGIGSGIVHDSDPESEWHESLLKGRFLTDPAPDFQLIETILWSPEDGFFLLDSHLQRLTRSATYFHFPIDRPAILGDLEKHASSWHEQKSDRETHAGQVDEQTAKRVRILLHHNGSFSIAATPCKIPNNTSLPLQDNSSDPVRATLAEATTDSTSPYLFHKTTVRGCYDREFHLASTNGFRELFFMNEKGEVTEGAISNIVTQKDGQYYTPPVSCGLLPGTLRAHLLETYPQHIQEKILTPLDLEKADHVYMVNAVRGIVEVVIKKSR